VIETEAAIRLGVFFGGFASLAMAEIIAPRRRLASSKPRRWLANLTIVLLDTVLVRLLFAAGAVGAAMLAAKQEWGLLNQLPWPTGLEVVLSVITLDLSLYLQHVAFHAVPVLWRLHMMHHADLDVDVTTGVRFHPVEVVLSMAIKVTVVILMGAPATAVLIFEILLNVTSMFTHSNLRVPGVLESMFRSLLVTPDMHRIHHSIRRHETNSNFGFNLSWWDHLFGTYRAEPQDAQTTMVLGLEQFRDPKRLTLYRMLLMPFTESPGQYPLSHTSRKT
jgi:sterol desaturase/sphingolipid hydroxylase (fatty acid hydroxylase superfamily)